MQKGGEVVCLKSARAARSADRREDVAAELAQIACGMSTEGMEAAVRFMRGWRPAELAPVGRYIPDAASS
jgi:hypothetical protein